MTNVCWVDGGCRGWEEGGVLNFFLVGGKHGTVVVVVWCAWKGRRKRDNGTIQMLRRARWEECFELSK